MLLIVRDIISSSTPYDHKGYDVISSSTPYDHKGYNRLTDYTTDYMPCDQTDHGLYERLLKGDEDYVLAIIEYFDYKAIFMPDDSNRNFWDYAVKNDFNFLKVVIFKRVKDLQIESNVVIKMIEMNDYSEAYKILINDFDDFERYKEIIKRNKNSLKWRFMH